MKNSVYDDVVEEVTEEAKDVGSKSKSKMTILMQGSVGKGISVVVKPTTKVERLLNAFCAEQNINPREHRIVYKGNVLTDLDEIGKYSIAENDVLRVVASQTGGVFAYFM